MTIKIVAVGGTVNPGNSTEQALRLAASTAEEAGADVTVFGSEYLRALPHYRGEGYGIKDGAEFVEAVRQADGVIVSAPGYHGSISGLVKNALDYLEDLAKDERPYLDGRAIGLIATAYGDQASMSTLQTLRSVVHALRGWPTPMGATVRVYQGLFSPDGECLEDRARMQLEMVGRQTVRGARALSAMGR
ncbi:NAD(P)H-dependent oxidoreductase [Tsuneonella sp. YG55]|uniref:NAD(P)H-dependent oxidoreductase n=1 Tax=Tsuneonella litorea TaxID=2976475 RepID=A0A9X2W408_9SPHN|nr:NAD(P)H-dependent oxidoreductase [Tsuneonella litorea]MCT2559615.1 NAD(P)H-dependent oxidoreductase [Tsuneonella litorea]